MAMVELAPRSATDGRPRLHPPAEFDGRITDDDEPLRAAP